MDPLNQAAHILLVDDDASIRLLVGQILYREGYAVSPSSDGTEAATMLADISPDLVLTDYAMPGMDGWELALLVRRRRPGTPVLLITGNPGALTKAQEPGNPFEGVLSKPFRTQELLSMIQELLEKSARAEGTSYVPEIPCEHQPKLG